MVSDPESNETPDSAPEEFDAVAAAKELEEAMAAAKPTVLEDEDMGGKYVETLEDEISKLNAIIAAEQRRTAQAKEALEKESARADRAQDDVEKAKARVEGDAKVKIEQKRRKMLISLIEVLDDLTRAIEAANQASENSPILDGIEAVERKFISELKQYGVEPVGEKVGDEFTPELHDALSMQTTEDAKQNNTIANVYAKGYKIGEDILRPARVIVFKHQG